MHAIAPADLDRFLRRLAAGLPCPVRLVLTGGSAAMVMGGVRPTGDVDFGVILAPRFDAHWARVEAAIAETANDTGIAAQYATDIDRWSLVSIPPTRRRTVPYRRIGRLSVHLLEPTCWAVYKLTRYLGSDVEDLRAVLRRSRVPWKRLAQLCGEALRASPRSTQLSLFRRQVERFFDEEGATVWGRRFVPAHAIRSFRTSAHLPLD